MLKACLTAVPKSVVKVSFRSKFTLPALDFSLKSLEPIISEDILAVHHGKHHQTYVNNLNVMVEKMQVAVAENDMDAVSRIAPTLKFNYGGHLNHSIYWKNLSPNGGKPSDELNNAIIKDFGSMDNMKQMLSAMTTAVQGSGWGWLCYDKTSKTLKLTTSSNQEPLEATTGLIPLFAIDVWEHAYYLQYKNVRADYVKAIWDIANWKDISENFSSACK